MNLRIATSGLLSVLSLLGTSASANEQAGAGKPVKAVIELFTSQGCSSCPPADAVLKTYAKDPDVIALSLPVDYWDYLGWKDTFANHANSERQRSYAKVRGDGAVYTPQAVVNGMVHVNGSSKSSIEGAIDLTSKAVQRVPVRFWQDRNTLNVSIGAGQSAREATVWLGVVQTSGTVDIKRGENSGSSIEYTNIVRDLSPIGLWKGDELNIQIPRGAVLAQNVQKCVVLVQEGRTGPIIAAASTSLF